LCSEGWVQVRLFQFGKTLSVLTWISFRNERYLYIAFMRIRNRTMREWLGSIMIGVMLMSQSASLWASMGPHLQNPQLTPGHCSQETQQVSDVKQNHCRQDCCRHTKACTSSCVSMCLVVGLSMLPSSTTSLLPQFDIKSVSQILIFPPHGIALSVLERPPK